MKLILFFLATFSLTLHSKTNSQRFPFPNPCGTNSRFCENPSKKIWHEFLASQPLDKQDEALFSGSCFHESPLFNPFTEHHGVFLFVENEKDQLISAGRFSFFKKENPYRDWTINEAIEELQRGLNTDNAFLYLQDDMAVNDRTVDDELVRYHFRKSFDNDQLLLVGYWGNSHIIFCRFHKQAE